MNSVSPVWPSKLPIVCACGLFIGVGCVRQTEGAHSAVAMAAGYQQRDSAHATSGAKIVPWIEVNAKSPASKANVADGLREWRNLSDTVIVTVNLGHAAQYYKELKTLFPLLAIVPGVTTSLELGHRDFASRKGWSRLAEIVRACCKATGGRRFLLESEIALKAYHRGACTIDLEALREGLKLLPKGITYLWYPTAVGSGEKLKRYMRLNQIVEDELDVHFLDHVSLNSPRSFWTGATRSAIAPLEKLAEKRTYPLIYCCGDKWWPKERLLDAIKLADERWPAECWRIVYPGQKLWVPTGRWMKEESVDREDFP